MRDDLKDLISALDEPLEILISLKEEYEEKQGNLTEALAQTPYGQALEAVTSIEIPSEATLDNLEEVESAIAECDDVALPNSFCWASATAAAHRSGLDWRGISVFLRAF